MTTTGATSLTAGSANTTTISPLDADSNLTGTQVHQAARFCSDLVKGGYTDWYLPSTDQIAEIYPNRVALGLPATLWSSREASSTGAYVSNLGTTLTITSTYKDVFNNVLCMR